MGRDAVAGRPAVCLARAHPRPIVAETLILNVVVVEDAAEAMRLLACGESMAVGQAMLAVRPAT